MKIQLKKLLLVALLMTAPVASFAQTSFDSGGGHTEGGGIQAARIGDHAVYFSAGERVIGIVTKVYGDDSVDLFPEVQSSQYAATVKFQNVSFQAASRCAKDVCEGDVVAYAINQSEKTPAKIVRVFQNGLYQLELRSNGQTALVNRSELVTM